MLKFLNSFNKPVFIVPGNWDWTLDKKSQWKVLREDLFSKIIKNLNNIINLNHKIWIGMGYQFIGYGEINGPELLKYRGYLNLCKKDVEANKISYNTLLKKFDNLFKHAKHKKYPITFLSHNIPFNTPLDLITNKTSPQYGKHFGSLIARKMIEKYQPLVCIGGHMHEHFGKCKIGKTTCINTGFGPNVNILLELEKNKIKRLEFYNK